MLQLMLLVYYVTLMHIDTKKMTMHSEVVILRMHSLCSGLKWCVYTISLAIYFNAQSHTHTIIQTRVHHILCKS